MYKSSAPSVLYPTSNVNYQSFDPTVAGVYEVPSSSAASNYDTQDGNAYLSSTFKVTSTDSFNRSLAEEFSRHVLSSNAVTLNQYFSPLYAAGGEQRELARQLLMQHFLVHTHQADRALSAEDLQTIEWLHRAVGGESSRHMDVSAPEQAFRLAYGNVLERTYPPSQGGVWAFVLKVEATLAQVPLMWSTGAIIGIIDRTTSTRVLGTAVSLFISAATATAAAAGGVGGGGSGSAAPPTTGVSGGSGSSGGPSAPSLRAAILVRLSLTDPSMLAVCGASLRSGEGPPPIGGVEGVDGAFSHARGSVRAFFATVGDLSFLCAPCSIQETALLPSSGCLTPMTEVRQMLDAIGGAVAKRFHGYERFSGYADLSKFPPLQGGASPHGGDTSTAFPSSPSKTPSGAISSSSSSSSFTPSVFGSSSAAAAKPLVDVSGGSGSDITDKSGGGLPLASPLGTPVFAVNLGDVLSTYSPLPPPVSTTATSGGSFSLPPGSSSGEGTAAVESSRPLWTCGGCHQSQSGHLAVLARCGHVMCSNCANAAEQSFGCPLCLGVSK